MQFCPTASVRGWYVHSRRRRRVPSARMRNDQVLDSLPPLQPPPPPKPNVTGWYLYDETTLKSAHHKLTLPGYLCNLPPVRLEPSSPSRGIAALLQVVADEEGMDAKCNSTAKAVDVKAANVKTANVKTVNGHFYLRVVCWLVSDRSLLFEITCVWTVSDLERNLLGIDPTHLSAHIDLVTMTCIKRVPAQARITAGGQVSLSAESAHASDAPWTVTLSLPFALVALFVPSTSYACHCPCHHS